MSQENVEIARKAWRAYGERGIDGAFAFFAEDCVCEDLPEAPDRGVYTGWEGMREREKNFFATLDDVVIEPVEFIDAGDDVVVVVTAVRAHGKGSGAPVDAQLVFVYELRDGKIVRDRDFTSRREALEAAGLRA